MIRDDQNRLFSPQQSLALSIRSSWVHKRPSLSSAMGSCFTFRWNRTSATPARRRKALFRRISKHYHQDGWTDSVCGHVRGGTHWGDLSSSLKWKWKLDKTKEFKIMLRMRKVKDLIASRRKMGWHDSLKSLVKYEQSLQSVRARAIFLHSGSSLIIQGYFGPESVSQWRTRREQAIPQKWCIHSLERYLRFDRRP